MPMNPEIKARWTAALRSGEYPQARESLQNADGYCCLGVLCELAVKDSVIATPIGPNHMGDYEYGSGCADSVLPYEVSNWAGLEGEFRSNPRVEQDDLPEGVEWDSDPTEEGASTLANMNDGGTPFSIIADIIDAQL